MANRRRGEISASLDGRDWTLCLTLGALAELEDTFGSDDVTALAERFSQGKFKSRDMIRILGAGLRGAGHTLTDAEVQDMQIEGGAVGFAMLVTELLNITFNTNDDSQPQVDDAAA